MEGGITSRLLMRVSLAITLVISTSSLDARFRHEQAATRVIQQNPVERYNPVLHDSH